MATYTSNINLHQWEGTDSFLRTDFNEDFLKIDTALGEIQDTVDSGVSSLQERITDNSYNIYNLMLQNYYDGKYTGYKTAMIFDGFMDESNIASKTDALLYSQSGQSLGISTVGESNVTNTASTSTTQIWGSKQTMISKAMTGNGYISGFCLQTSNGASASGFTLSYSITINGVEVATGSQMASHTTSSSGGTTGTVTTETAYFVAGDTVTLSVSSSTSLIYYYLNSQSYLAGTVYITSATGTSSTLTSVDFDLPASDGMYAWVRHSGCTLSMSVDGNSFTNLGATSTVNLQGDSCLETAFSLDTVTAAGDAAFQIDLALGSNTSATLYDYGVILV